MDRDQSVSSREDYIQRAMEEHGLLISKRQACQFNRYYELLVERNKVINLTAITEFEEVVRKHFIDSVSICKKDLLKDDMSVIDVGTGAGFPGVPLLILVPKIQMTLLDSLLKRVEFLEDVVEELGLVHAKVFHGRAEDFAREQQHREQYDVVVSRAVSNLSTLSEYCVPFLKCDGLFLAYKAEKAKEEMDAAKNALHILGAQYQEEYSYSLGNDMRVVIIYRKVSVTDNRYPRRAGQPGKQPLK